MENVFYRGDRLLQMLDLDRNRPEIYIVSGNRSAGKTTYFNNKLLTDFIYEGKRFAIIVRNVSDIDGIADQFFKDICALFWPEIEYSYAETGYGADLLINGQICGYALPLYRANKIKRLSHLLSDTQQMIFDEFQSDRYLKNEVQNFISIHTSVARGRGQQVRYVPVYMLSNKLSLLNPYFTAFGISQRLRKNTKFLRGNGWVMEQNYNENALRLQKESAFVRAFSNIDDTAQMVYLEEKEAFIQRPKTPGRYICTLIYDATEYGIVEYPNEGFVYAGKRFDPSYPTRFVVSSKDHNTNQVLIARNSIILDELRYYFEHGCFRFSDVGTKAAILSLLSY